MGCMNGKCSEEASDSADRETLVQQPRYGDHYSVSPLPESPSVNDPRLLANPVTSYQGHLGGPRVGFEQSDGGTLKRELNQHMINSMNPTEGHPRHDNYAGNNMNGGAVLPGSPVRHPQPPVTISDVKTARGKEIFHNLKRSYDWNQKFDHPSQEFLSHMDRLYMECQLHLTALSTRGSQEHKREADMIVKEMMTVRDHWGPELLPNSICNAFVRERIPMTLGPDARQFRIDCAQFFEPVPFYGSHQEGNPGELMKLYRFSVYDLARNEVVLRYYLERSNVTQLYHVLCFTCGNHRGQVHPYGTELPSYWDIRERMLGDVYSRLMSALSGSQPPPPHIATLFPSTQGKGSVVIQVPMRN